MCKEDGSTERGRAFLQKPDGMNAFKKRLRFYRFLSLHILTVCFQVLALTMTASTWAFSWIDVRLISVSSEDPSSTLITSTSWALMKIGSSFSSWQCRSASSPLVDERLDEDRQITHYSIMGLDEANHLQEEDADAFPASTTQHPDAWANLTANGRSGSDRT